MIRSRKADPAFGSGAEPFRNLDGWQADGQPPPETAEERKLGRFGAACQVSDTLDRAPALTLRSSSK